MCSSNSDNTTSTTDFKIDKYFNDNDDGECDYFDDNGITDYQTPENNHRWT